MPVIIMIKFLWLVFSYLLGAVPSGYLITKFSTQKNILEIGWKKTSGSNVFRNIGKWQGVMTGVFDGLKGYLAVYGARELGLPLEIQMLSGIAALIGNNWSLFLDFAGGRGLATFAGAGLFLFPKVLGISLIPAIFLALVWNSSIATIILLLIIIFIPNYLGQPETATIYTLMSLVPIFVKRLSPIKDIFPLNQKLALFRNRLIFDNDQFLREPRIKRIIKRLTKS